MAVEFYIALHNNALSQDNDARALDRGEYRPKLATNEYSISVRLSSIVVKNARSESDASRQFLEWVMEAGWDAVDTLRAMGANPYDIHAVATQVASHTRDWSRSFGIVQRIQHLHIDTYDIYVDPYAPVEFRFLSEREDGAIIVSLDTPVRMRDRTGDDIGTTPISSLAPALAKTDAPIYVKSGSDVGAWGDYKPPVVEWFIDDAVSSGMRVFDRPGRVLFSYAGERRIAVDLPEGDAIIGIDAGDAFTGTDTLYLNDWEWTKAILDHAMIYAPANREKPSLAMYDDVVAWFHRRVSFRGGEFDEALDALRKALVDLFDIGADMECDDVISSGERFCDVLDDLLYNRYDTITVLRKDERGFLLQASDSDKRVDRRKLYFVLSRS